MIGVPNGLLTLNGLLTAPNSSATAKVCVKQDLKHLFWGNLPPPLSPHMGRKMEKESPLVICIISYLRGAVINKYIINVYCLNKR